VERIDLSWMEQSEPPHPRLQKHSPLARIIRPFLQLDPLLNIPLLSTVLEVLRKWEIILSDLLTFMAESPLVDRYKNESKNIENPIPMGINHFFISKRGAALLLYKHTPQLLRCFIRVCLVDCGYFHLRTVKTAKTQIRRMHILGNSFNYFCTFITMSKKQQDEILEND
jgi:hypothetical protein